MAQHLDNETQLILEARSGSSEAFLTLARQYERHIYRLALRITGNDADAEDALQQTLLNAYEKLGAFNGGSLFYTWLVRIATNEALMILRRRRTGRFVSLGGPGHDDDDSAPLEIAASAESPEEYSVRSSLREHLESALEALPEPYRIVVILRDVEGLSGEEVAATLGLSLPAVKSRLLRGRLFLRKRLERVLGSGPNHRKAFAALAFSFRPAVEAFSAV